VGRVNGEVGDVRGESGKLLGGASGSGAEWKEGEVAYIER
jgi:hypothetical protein